MNSQADVTVTPFSLDRANLLYDLIVEKFKIKSYLKLTRFLSIPNIYIFFYKGNHNLDHYQNLKQLNL